MSIAPFIDHENLATRRCLSNLRSTPRSWIFKVRGPDIEIPKITEGVHTEEDMLPSMKRAELVCIRGRQNLELDSLECG